MAAYYPPRPAWRTGLACRCPRCGRGRLFDGFLTVRARCAVCDLDLRGHDAGDGPAVFVVFLLGGTVVPLALWVELAYAPPLWLHVALWFPLTLLGALAALRPLKGVMVALQYRHRSTGLVD